MGVFLFDLVRTSRRGRAALIRSAYGLVLLVALGNTFGPTSDVRPAEMARFAEQFTSVFLMVQLGAVFLVTPAYAAGAIAEERQRRTLDDLLVTDLSRWEIVLGKLFARWLQVLAVLLAGLPVLSLMLSLGGVDPLRLAAGFLIAILTALSLAALGLLLSVQARTVSSAVAFTYGMALLYCAFTACVPPAWVVNPVFMLAQLLGGWGDDNMIPYLLPIFGLSQLVLTGALTVGAIQYLRSSGRATGRGELLVNQPVRTAQPGPPSEGRLPPPWAAQLSAPVEAEHSAAPPIDGDPLLWKDKHFASSPRSQEPFRAAGKVFMTGIFAYGLLLMSILFGGLGGLRLFFSGIIIPLYSYLLIGVTFAAAGGISREREQQTLDGLLVLPGGREAVLWAKWLGCLRRVWGQALALIVLLALGAIFGNWHAVALPLLLFSVAAHVGFFASLGLYLSVVSRSTVRAYVAATVWLLGLGLLLPLFVCGLSPLGVFWHWTLPAFDHSSPEYGITLAGIVIYTIAGGMFWFRASERFRQEADCERRP